MWFFLGYWTSLVGRSSPQEQPSNWLDAPGHWFPPLEGAGLSQDLDRTRVPLSWASPSLTGSKHRHWPQAPQPPQLPSTENQTQKKIRISVCIASCNSLNYLDFHQDSMDLGSKDRKPTFHFCTPNNSTFQRALSEGLPHTAWHQLAGS